MALTEEQLLHMYRQMLTIRSFETLVPELWKEGLVTGAAHSYIGEEAVAVGVCAALRPVDYITSTHRGHGHCIAKGGDLKKMMAELAGRSDGYCNGKGGSMHIADFDIGILGACGIVGGGIPMSVGAGLSAKLRGTDQVAVCFFGDGASNEGSCHEAMNLASVWKIPTIFVCENNGYAITTPVTYSVNVKNIAERGAAYGIPGVVVDGMDPVAVYEVVSEAVVRARRGDGPTLVECKTFRFEGHSIRDDGSYRPKEEVESWYARDPIPRFESRLREMGILSPERVEEIKAGVERDLQEAAQFARTSPKPLLSTLFDGLYA